MNSLLTCPVCGSSFNIENRTYKCIGGHCFDMAKEGYVNLLLSGKSTDFTGDDKEMVASRTRFLEGGWYSPLRDKVCELIDEFGTESTVLLDSGCGEGYYTSAYAQKVAGTLGIDISKAAVRHASKKCKNAEFAVASVYHLPVADSSFDIIVNCFSPMANEEFLRVLKPKGYFLYVVPGVKHLWELKNVLYDNPYENEEKDENYNGFELVKKESVSTCFDLSDSLDIMALFHMTPYTYKTPKEGAERLSKLDHLHVTAEFTVHVFRKI